MSTSLGPAGVTAVLRDILTNRFKQDPVSATIGFVTVSAEAPDRIDLMGTSDPNQVNIFLHQVTRNQGWANEEMPSRDGEGRRIKSPPLVLDLHYLITVYGERPFYAEILLGEVVQEFHERPVPTRQIIDQALNPSPMPSGFPTLLAQSGLSQQIERIRISQESMSNEEVSKLWSALQARYRTTVAYQVTTVIIESPAMARPSLPVRRRFGSALHQASPYIFSVRATDDPIAAPIAAGSGVTITGKNLQAPDMLLLIGEVDLTSEIIVRRDDKIEFILPDPLPAGLRAGVQAVQIVHQNPLSDPADLRNTSVSNLGPFVLSPGITSTTVSVAGTTVIDGVTYSSGTIEVHLSPAAGTMQKVAILLNPVDPDLPGVRAYRIAIDAGNGVVSPAVETSVVEGAFTHIASGEYLIRIVVDGAESALGTDGTGHYDSPTVTI